MKDNKILPILLGLALVISTGSSFGITHAQNNFLNSEVKVNGKKHDHMIDVKHTVEKIDKGIVMTITSENSDTVKKLQSQKMPHRKDDKITVTQVNLEKGIKITMVSDDPQLIQKLQARKDSPFKPTKLKLHKKDMMPMQNVEKKVEKIDKGVILTLTSKDVNVVEKLHSNSNHIKPFDGKINMVMIKLDNGIQITITSEDSTLVKKIQEQPEPTQSPFHQRITRGDSLSR